MSVRFIKSLNALIESIQTLEFLSPGFVALPSEYSRNFQILSEIYWRIDLSSECIDIKKDNGIPDCSQNATISTQDIAEILSVMVPNQLSKSNNQRCEKVWHIT